MVLKRPQTKHVFDSSSDIAFQGFLAESLLYCQHLMNQRFSLMNKIIEIRFKESVPLLENITTIIFSMAPSSVSNCVIQIKYFASTLIQIK